MTTKPGDDGDIAPTAGAPDVTLRPSADLLDKLDRAASCGHPDTIGMVRRGFLSDVAVRIRELEAEREWKPIETAPTMQTILMFAPIDVPPGNYQMDTGFKVPDGQFVWGGRDLKAYDRQPTLWMHVPKPPSAVQVAEGSRAAALHQSPDPLPPVLSNPEEG